MDAKEVRKKLEERAEESYRDFSAKLIPGEKRPLLGVRIPLLRKLAKEIARGDFRTYFAQAADDSFEEIMIQGMVIGYAKMPLDECMRRIRDFVPKIDNWSVNDSFCSTLKIARRYPREMWEFLMEYLYSTEYFYSGKEFTLRFVAVMLMDHYLTDEWIDEVLAVYASMRHEGYYLKMGVAWGLATAYAKYRDQTEAVLLRGLPDEETCRMALRKIRESFRVSDEDKARWKKKEES